MSWWPFGRRKVASPPDGFTRALTWHSEQAAIGALLAAPETTAAAETAAGLLSRSLSVAEVTPQSEATMAVTPSWLARVGSDLVRCGSHLSVIELDDGIIKLKPAHSWTVLSGSTEPDSWVVRAEIPIPNGREQIITRWDGVVCAHWQTCPETPWKGLGPLTGSALTAALLAHATRSLGLSQAGPIGGLLSSPGDDKDRSSLSDTISALDGQVAVMPSTGDGFGTGTDAAPQREWVVNRIGPDPGAPNVALARDAAHAVLSACGVPLEMAGQGTGGSAAKREAFRQYERLTVGPISRCLSAELTRKLDVPDPGVKLDLTELASSDMAGRARAFKIFATHGYTPQGAAQMLRLPAPSSSPQEADTDAAG